MLIAMILIVVTKVDLGYVVTLQEFTNAENCENAASTIINGVPNNRLQVVNCIRK